ncbi:aldo/keto reductase [Virgibacillus pantothenticus]|uniref:Oxidoreductase n=1 Tax=Virgibacillus pantothenticus TaxID=1473 RepID=A0A0L0QPE4_VIRPA|nr:aldo/keto reductase [Virgibacillus pantothenticus]KNE20431.1 oxidoreductase [Virgibacillus pantothenticus]MED3735932.1 aldo/keto reductase [Virgibacillus pantothenticus]QTY17814.1 aldo/keto reductase [Virgibacillus pantothenticus]SIS52381.1 Predicted oxidoreductase [Virgibacillus pantothenticus]
MKINQLGKSSIYLSELTLGCMSLGTDVQTAKYIIDHALDNGINHLDTADLYDFGENERIIGEALKQKRERVILTTKVGNHFDKLKKTWFWDPSKKHIQNGVKESLQRLQTDYIDFYMLHGGTIEDPIEETIEAFEELKQEGLIRAYGLSSIRPNVIREYVKKSSIDGVMMQYSLLDRRPEEEMLDLLHENQISVLARGPLAKGILSNNGNNQINKKAKDGFLGYSYEELHQLYGKLTSLAEPIKLNELALLYVLQHPAVASAVFGASSVNQLKESITNNVTIPLSDQLYQQLKTLTKALTYEAHR